MSTKSSKRVLLTPQEGWLSDGRQVLCFRPTRWERDYHRLEIITGEFRPDQEVPLLKTRRELSRAEAIKLWREKLQAGWRACEAQW